MRMGIRKLKQYLDVVGVLFIVLDVKGKVIFINKKGCDILGYDRSEVINKDWFSNFLPKNTREEAKNIHTKVISGETEDIEYHNNNNIITKNGNKRTIAWHNGILRDKDGKFIGSISSGEDITERETVKKELMESEERYRVIADSFKEKNKELKTIFNSVPVAIWYKDLNNNILKVNKAAADLVGIKIEDIEGMNAEELFPSEYNNCYKDDLEVFNSKKPKMGIIEKLLISPTKSLWVKTDKIPCFSDDGEVSGIIAFSTDITPIKNSEENLKEIAHNLKDINKELEQFAYIASHDLQEPLRVICSYCQLLKNKYYYTMDEEGKKYLNYVIDASLRMKTLIKELLDYSRVGRKDKPFEKINLEGLLQEVLHDFEEYIKETKAEIIVESNLPEVWGIRFRIKQLLHNLISNSLKFRSDKNPIIRIGCCEESSDGYWLFYVKDNGIGIDNVFLDRIFGVFKRLYSREKYPGTGIGLALCKRIVETHKGHIWADSNVKDGTYIYFTISKSKTIPQKIL